MNGKTLLAFGLCLISGGLLATLDAQRAGSFMGSSEDPGIKYSTARLNNLVEDVNRRIRKALFRSLSRGAADSFGRRSTHCRSPSIRSCWSFRRDSLQGKLINEQSPRAIYFNDRVTLGWVRDGEFIEVAAHDESAGVVFYTLEQRDGATYRAPQFMRGAAAPGVIRRAIRSACPAW